MSACWFIAHSIHVCNITWTYANSIFCPRKAFIVIRVFGQKKNDLHIHLQGFRGFFGNFFCLSFCSFSYVLAPVIDLLLVMLPIQKLQRKHHWDRQFLLPWSRQLCAYISGCIKPITLIWVSLERSCVPADVGYRWYPFLVTGEWAVTGNTGVNGTYMYSKDTIWSEFHVFSRSRQILFLSYWLNIAALQNISFLIDSTTNKVQVQVSPSPR